MSAEEETPAATVPEETPETKVEEEPEEEVEYLCPPEFDETEDMRKLFVGGLDKETTEDELKELFAQYGEIAAANVIKKEQRAYGFVTFAKCDNLDDCLLGRPHKCKERDLEVKRAVPKEKQSEVSHLKVKKLHVGNLPETFDPKPLKTYLRSRHPKKYGTIEDITFLKSKDESGEDHGQHKRPKIQEKKVRRRRCLLRRIERTFDPRIGRRRLFGC